jgi:hypothetical protein
MAEHRDVPLVWASKHEAPANAGTNLAPNRFKVLPLVDKRPDPKQIGVNIQKPAHPLPVTTKDDVSAWATERFEHILRGQGFNLVAADPTVAIKGEILKFGVTEAGVFNGEVELGIVAETPKGESIWQGTLSGKSKRWGRSNALENYYEALTSAFLDAARKLAEEPAFVAALPK